MKRAKLFVMLGALIIVAFAISSCFPVKGSILLLEQKIGWEPGKPVVIEAAALLFTPDPSSNYQWSVEIKPQYGSWTSRNDLVKVIPSTKNSKAVVYLPVYENFEIKITAKISGTSVSGEHGNYSSEIVKHVSEIPDVLVEVFEKDLGFNMPDLWFEDYLNGNRSNSTRTPVYYKLNKALHPTAYYSRIGWGVYPKNESDLPSAQVVFHGDPFYVVNSSSTSITTEMENSFKSVDIAYNRFKMRIEPYSLVGMDSGWRVRDWKVSLYVEQNVLDDPDTKVFLVKINREDYRATHIYNIKNEFYLSEASNDFREEAVINPIVALLHEWKYGTLWDDDYYFAVVVANFNTVSPSNVIPPFYTVKGAEMVW
ncbi:hypothetical protein [Mesotoga prima]|uniref:hypothetical protein n=1 Tax=Mesotoga prima TaxID=1184387 RepID=UPI002CCBCBB1|nr:hypothetical protein [Mesotoga prima]HOZ99848.1 hypothetical protein [Mesotoga prima]HQN60285.1 hypothetical protein [Mesotoga prima]HUM22498.1 hypothetical protein [Mesotoga prima]